jgi:colicin import membrane protein
MAEQKESSVLFSLKELMNLEEDRIKQEDASRRAQAEAEQQARMAAERRVREEEEQRIQAEEDRRRTEEQRAREEAARLEAIRHGEIERARADAEAAARLEAMRHQQEHEHRITALKQDKHKRNLMLAAIGASLLLIVGGVGAGITLKNKSDEAAAASAKHAQELAEQQATIDKLSAQAEEQTQKINDLITQLGTAGSDAEKALIQKQLEAARSAQQAAQAAAAKVRAQRASNVSGGGSSPKPAKPCNCAPGDPLCSCIQ